MECAIPAIDAPSVSTLKEDDLKKFVKIAAIRTIEKPCFIPVRDSFKF